MRVLSQEQKNRLTEVKFYYDFLINVERRDLRNINPLVCNLFIYAKIKNYYCFFINLHKVQVLYFMEPNINILFKNMPSQLNAYTLYFLMTPEIY